MTKKGRKRNCAKKKLKMRHLRMVMERNGNADAAGRESQRSRRCHPQYLVVPNTKSIEQSVKCYSRLFSNGVYVRMLDRLSEEINKYYWDNLETKKDFCAKMAFMDDIERAIRRRKDWRFKLFPSGSTMTQLASKGSDLDVAFWCPDARQFFPSEADAAYHFLHWIRHFLKTDREIADHIDDLEYVEAKVPVLRIKSKAGIEVDLSACTESFVSGIHNSYLIRGFVSWDSRFAPLCMLVKDWATRNEVKNPKLGGFNSYAMVLLVIHFLQCGVSPPILPNLQKLFPERYARNVDGIVRFPMALDFADVELSRDQLGKVIVAKTDGIILMEHKYYLVDCAVGHSGVVTCFLFEEMVMATNGVENFNLSLYSHDSIRFQR
ncbi:hypothetical protein ANCDUO_15106 [Ancylostoma duodenale]|uniref:Poly(A) RNA polymerase mitochondrial-like central palm domain-containing protein n=1 Tax=Ancylostoma duodenale TaxID=51022 RepID=A0A0C2G1C8_9BILA|nr:hypothetical protein ANCDUO_15106 [Ancylostoma duodenale]